MKNIILLLTVVIMSASCAKQSQQFDDPTTEATTLVGEPEIQTATRVASEALQAAPPTDYNYLDPQRIVPTVPLTQAINYFKANKASIANPKYITIVDMTQKSNKKRMYVIDMVNGSVGTYLVAHGKNSDPNNDGYAEKFSNTDGSLMSSLGFYLTDVTYQGSKGLSLRLRGLQSTNSNAYSRAIVMHGADYVSASGVGRSWGCPAIERKYVNTLIPALKGRSLLYIYKAATTK
ncbi:MAG: murein L,D-transpeptidase catalytic domain family protein [Bdellovibrionaceae bacterium]|nr:murein L,D-transpeptidase catalytic domain family protein [Pseudobdellovibrionaceae bacterium]